MSETAYRQVADWLRTARSTVVFTGAGMSTESGIPDFRSPGGIWSKYRTVYYDEFMASAEARAEYWRQKCEGHRAFADAQPNVGHQVIASWESRRLIRGVITQNIDGLHQVAGNGQVLELHGTARSIKCQDCGELYPADGLVEEFLATQRVPCCAVCKTGRLKHATVSFGQSLSPQILDQAVEWCSQAELLLAIGSSLVVSPAADLPRIAKETGARVVIINRDPTPLDSLADVIIRQSIGDVLGAVNHAAVDPGKP